MDKVKEVLHIGGERADKASERTNKAAWLSEKGAKLHVDRAEVPSPGENEVLIHVHAVAINPVDWKVQDYGLFVQKWPTVLGSDVAGEIVEVGPSVTRFRKGDRVISHTIALATGQQRDAGFQHYAVARTGYTAAIPTSLSYPSAVVLPLAISTAATGLYQPYADGFFGLPLPSLNPTPSGKTLLVWGGSSSVGATTIQLAVASGAQVVAVASARNHAFCKQLGAAAVVDYHGSEENVVENVVQAVRALLGGDGDFLGVYDAISTPDQSHKYVFPILARLGGGNAALVLGNPPKELPPNVKTGNVFAINDGVRPVWEQYVPPALQQGALKAVPEPLVVGKGLESVQKGFDESKKGVSARKVVVEL